MTDPAADPFPADALELNRAGKLTDQQRARFTRLARSWRRNELVGALVMAVAGLVLLTGTGPASSALVRFGGGAGALVIAGFFLVRSFPGADPIGADLRSGRVESIEGAFRKTSWSSGGGNTVTHYSFEVAGTRFDEPSTAGYEAAPDAGIVRLFYLPRSKQVVNLERLPDRPVDPAVLASPMAAVQALAGTFRSHDRGRLAEAAATAVGIEDAMKAENARRMSPPPPEQRDPRPLAEAILGTWSMGPMMITFSADGTAEATVMGRTQRGHWSVDAAGRLHHDAQGTDEAGDAWIVGDTLTIIDGEMALAWQRVDAG